MSNKGNEKRNLLDTSPEDDFRPVEMFGNNYQQGILNPQNQQQQQSAPDQNIQFEEFHLANQPSFYSNTTSTTQSSPILEPTHEDNLGFGEPVVNPAGIPFNPPPVEPTKSYHFWNIEYYSFLFNVNTKEVAHRIGRSLFPFPPRFFEVIQDNPDFYGPFWIASTLVFMMAAAGNVASYLSALRSDTSDKWDFDTKKLSVAAGVIYGYLSIVSLVLFGISKWNKMELKLLNIVCIYGYSFFIYVPVSILCVIPIVWVRLGLVALAALLSTSLIVMNFFKAFTGHLAQGIIYLIVMAALHVGFAITCEVYFFNY